MLTRRQLLANAGAAAAAGVAGPALFAAALDAPPAQAATPRRCVALGPAGCIVPGCPQDLRAADNRTLLAQSGTRWVRLWADWPTLMPAPGTLAPDRVAALDDQIAHARADGLRTILTLYRFPAWVNGVVQAPSFMPPADLSTGGAWGQFVAWTIARYGGAVDVLELCNEPNLQWSARRVAPETVAAMFATAQRIADDLGSRVVLAGPGISDVRGYDDSQSACSPSSSGAASSPGRASPGRTTTTPTSPMPRAGPPTSAGAWSDVGRAGRTATPAIRSC
jgi:hypothetical protein